jgi:hypothetical protein
VGGHRHGRYHRYARPCGSETFAVQRYWCPECAVTISVLPADRLPYRSVAGARLEAFFNEAAEASVSFTHSPQKRRLVAPVMKQYWLLNGFDDCEEVPPNLSLVLDRVCPQTVVNGGFAVADAHSDG